MGYYNPVLAYGEDRAIEEAAAAGANGFIMCDLPPEEAINFREKCRKYSMSYIPLIAPSTSLHRIKFLASIADSFIYVVSKVCPNFVTLISACLFTVSSRYRWVPQVPQSRER